jgi:protocatechuate 3,4-dioxygenase beta subunit
MTSRQACTAFALFVLGVGGAHAMQRSAVPLAPLATGVSAGTIVDAVTSQPIANGTVTITRNGTSIPAVTADDQGRFVFRGLAAGDWRIMATQAGYATGWYGADAPSAAEQAFDLATGETVTGVVIRMWQYAVVSGTVTDANQEPVVGASVTATGVDVLGGRTTFEGLSRQTETDNRGIFRLTNLTPGDFAIAVLSPANASPPKAGYSPSGYPTLFYPDTTSTASASVLTLGGGEERSGIDFHLTPRRAFVVSGTVTGPGWSAQLNLRPADSARIPNTADIRTAAVNAQGRFSFPAVSPGPYVIEVAEFPTSQAPPGTLRMRFVQNATGVAYDSAGGLVGILPLAPLPSGPTLWAAVPITVDDKNIDDLQVALAPGARITGGVVFQGAADRPTAAARAATPVMVLSADGQDLGFRPASGIGSDGHFQTIGVPPGRYGVFFYPRALRGWTPASVMVGGQEMIGEPLTVGTVDVSATFTFTDRPGQLSGSVEDAAGQPAPDATIYVFSTDRRKWANTTLGSGSARAIRPARNGRYQSTLLPGEYFVAAVEVTAQVGWQRTDLLDRLAKVAKTVTIVVGHRVTLDLTVPKGQ